MSIVHLQLHIDTNLHAIDIVSVIHRGVRSDRCIFYLFVHDGVLRDVHRDVSNAILLVFIIGLFRRSWIQLVLGQLGKKVCPTDLHGLMNV